MGEAVPSCSRDTQEREGHSALRTQPDDSFSGNHNIADVLLSNHYEVPKCLTTKQNTNTVLDFQVSQGMGETPYEL